MASPRGTDKGSFKGGKSLTHRGGNKGIWVKAKTKGNGDECYANCGKKSVGKVEQNRMN